MDIDSPSSPSTLSLPQLQALPLSHATEHQPFTGMNANNRSGELADRLSRQVAYLRLSLTSACAMRCSYCRPQTNNNPKDEKRLSTPQLLQLVTHLVQHYGIQKIRLTGGDPTSHPQHLELIKKFALIDGLDDLAMTTNGLTLATQAKAYYNAGLHRLNISLDSLRADCFHRLTGVNGLKRVQQGIDKALSLPFRQIKLNSVVIRGENEQELPQLIKYAADLGVPIRFIELMPMGPLVHEWNQRYVSEQRMMDILHPHIKSWLPLEQGHDAARTYRVILHNQQEVTIGFITPMSCNFCAQCNRIRIAADGRFYPCLMDRPTTNLTDAFNPENNQLSPERLHELLLIGLGQKAEEHPHDGFGIMTQIGG